MTFHSFVLLDFVARLSTHDAPTSPPRARGWHNDQFGWGGWVFGQRTEPILAGIVAQPAWSPCKLMLNQHVLQQYILASLPFPLGLMFFGPMPVTLAGL